MRAGKPVRPSGHGAPYIYVGIPHAKADIGAVWPGPEKQRRQAQEDEGPFGVPDGTQKEPKREGVY